MDHEYAETMLGEYLDDETYQMAKRVLARLPGEVGYNPGSQIVQIVDITALDKVDHFIKEQLGIKYYIRYMDDFILIHHSERYLERCLGKIKAILSSQKMEVHESKTSIQPLSKPTKFLGFFYRLTDTGKVVILADPKKVKHERRKIARMVNLVEAGELTKHDVDVHFKAWKASIRYGNYRKLVYRLNRWYEGLWKGVNHVNQKEKNGHRT